MPLYRVIHRPVTGGCGYENTIVADNAADAIAKRNTALGLDAVEECAYDVEVQTVPDPDGSRTAFWLKHFGSAV